MSLVVEDIPNTLKVEDALWLAKAKKNCDILASAPHPITLHHEAKDSIPYAQPV